MKVQSTSFKCLLNSTITTTKFLFFCYVQYLQRHLDITLHLILSYILLVVCFLFMIYDQFLRNA